MPQLTVLERRYRPLPAFYLSAEALPRVVIRHHIRIRICVEYHHGMVCGKLIVPARKRKVSLKCGFVGKEPVGDGFILRANLLLPILSCLSSHVYLL